MWILEFLREPQVAFVVASIAGIVGVFLLFALMPQKVALDPVSYIAFRLEEKRIISHDTRMFRFALQTKSHRLGLPVGQHVSLRHVDFSGKKLTRSYTPTSSDEDVGYVVFVIKVYFPEREPETPGGKMSLHLEKLQIGDTIDMRGPKGNLTYIRKGIFRIKGRADQKVRRLGMMAGGTGITPMLQIISAIIREGSSLELSLIFANKSEKDILLRDTIEFLAASHSNFRVHYTLDTPPENWDYSKGFITTKMVEAYLPAPAQDTLILMCGPPPMLKFACLPALDTLGYSETMHFSF